MSEARALDVWLHDRLAGTLTLRGDEVMQFDYASDDAPWLSLSLRQRSQSGPTVRNWFANLLPEGEARTLAIEQHGLAWSDDFGLLHALGRECAGAVTVLARGSRPELPGDVIEYEPLEMSRIEAWIAAPRRRALGIDMEVRLSLAGAQHKAAVLRFEDGSLVLPTQGAPSSHILKIPNRELPGIVTLEALGMRLAAASGLRTAGVELLATDPRSLLVERYDRLAIGAGRHARIHQEDFCQALGIAPEHKYEEHGGPGLATVFNHLRRWGAAPDRVTRLLELTVFNLILGNADAHAKNLSLLHRDDGTIELAPAYDLVPSGLIAGVDRGLAMRIGAARTIDEVTTPDWEALARDIGIAKALVTRMRADLAARVVENLAAVCDRLVSEGADAAVLTRAARVLRMRARAVDAGERIGGAALFAPPREPWAR